MPKPISVKNFTEITKALQGVVKELKNISSNTIEKVDDEFKKAKKNVENLKEEVKDLNDELGDMAKEGGITASFKSNKIKKVGKEIDELAAKISSCANPADLKKYNKEIGNLSKKLDEAKKSEPFKYFSDKIKQTHAPLKGFSGILGNTGEGISAMEGTLSKLPGILGKAGAAAKGLGGAMGGVSKLLSGPAGIVAAVAFEAVKAVIKIDTYIKNLNKKFAAIRGPQIMGADVKKQFTDFNKAVFNISENLHDGLKADEVYDFMASITLAGKSLATLNNGFISYRDTVHIAARASKVFGMDITKTGDIMGKMSIEMGMNLKEVDRAFINVAFDAEKSGLSTDKFWNAIENASAGLAFYGKFIESASRNMKAFTESQLMGAQEAVGVTEEVTQAFNKMSTEEGMALLQLSKGGLAAAKKMFGDLESEITKKAEAASERVIELQAKYDLDKDPDVLKELEKTRTEAAKYQTELIRYSKAASGDQVAMAQNLAALTDKSPKFLLDLIEGIGQGVDVSEMTGNRLETILKGIEGTGIKIGRQNLRYMIDLATENGQKLKNIITNTGFVEKASDKLYEVSDELNTLNENSDPETINKVSSNLSQILGIDKESAKFFATAAASNEKFSLGLQDILEQNKDGKITAEQAQKNIADLVKSTRASKTVTQKGIDQQEEGQKTIANAYEDTYKKVRDQTLSLADMTEIATDGAKYQLAMMTGIDNISGYASKILDVMTEGKKTPEQKKDTKLWKKMYNEMLFTGGITAEEKAFNLKKRMEEKKAEADDKGNSEESRKAAQEQIDKAQAALTAMGRSGDLQEGILDQITLLAVGGDDAKKAYKDFVSKLKTKTVGEATKEPLGRAMMAYAKSQGLIQIDLKGGPDKLLLPEDAPSKQGLRQPEIVTKPGGVILHPGEGISPKGKTSLFTEGGPTGGAGVGAGKMITINVTATEKDLAQKIANEVRAVLYKESLTR